MSQKQEITIKASDLKFKVHSDGAPIAEIDAAEFNWEGNLTDLLGVILVGKGDEEGGDEEEGDLSHEGRDNLDRRVTSIEKRVDGLMEGMSEFCSTYKAAEEDAEAESGSSDESEEGKIAEK